MSRIFKQKKVETNQDIQVTLLWIQLFQQREVYHKYAPKPLKIGKEHVLLVECSVSNERNGKIPKRPI